MSLTPRRELRPLALASEIMQLPNLHGYLKFPGPLPVARIKLEYEKRAHAAERFVACREAPPAAAAPAGLARIPRESERRRTQSREAGTLSPRGHRETLHAANLPMPGNLLTSDKAIADEKETIALMQAGQGRGAGLCWVRQDHH